MYFVVGYLELLVVVDKQLIGFVEEFEGLWDGSH